MLGFLRVLRILYNCFLIGFILLANVMCRKTKSVPVEGKIIGGIKTKIEEFPYAAKLFNFDSFCAGAIINSWTVLTAAHCFGVNNNINDMIVEVGSTFIQQNDAEYFDVFKFVIHEDYNKAMLFAADIALIFVDGPIKFGPTIQKAMLTSNNDWMNTKNDIVAVGWGWITNTGPMSNEGLMKTSLKFVTKEKCQRAHNITLTNEMFCLYGEGTKDTCKGDSGGCVSWKGRIIGIVSHGDGCSLKGKPSVYINIYNYLKWIEHNVKIFLKLYCKEKINNSKLRF